MNQVTTATSGSSARKAESASEPVPAAAAPLDPITVEVIRSYFDSTARQMRNLMVRGSFNPIIYEMHDFSLGLYTKDAELIAEGPGIPAFLGTLTFAIKDMVRYVGEENLEEGDVILSTFPYFIGAHPQDATLVRPIFVGGRLFGYTSAKAHWLDLGAKDIYSTDTTDVFQEGLKLFGVKLVEAGKLNREITEIIRANTRTPASVLGDMTAQISACNLGAERVHQLVAKYGADVVERSVAAILDHGELIARKAIAAMPDGEWTAEAALDNDGISDSPVPIKVKISIKGDEIFMDTTGSAPQQKGPINCLYARTASVARLVLKMVIAPGYSANEGFFRPLKLHCPLGSVLNPEPPAPTFLYGWPSRPMGAAIFKAFTQIAPELSVAKDGCDLGGMMFSWADPQDGSFRAGGFDECVGQGASIDADGENAVVNFTLGESQNVPVEIAEERYPLRVERYELWEDSAGAGRYRGGLGVRKFWYPLLEMRLIATIDQTKFPAWGIDGGADGAANALALKAGSADESRRGKVSGFILAPGDRVELCMGGGGGWGNPFERDPQRVLDDAIGGYVTTQAAEKLYGVVLEGRGGQLAIDSARTAALRAAVR